MGLYCCEKINNEIEKIDKNNSKIIRLAETDAHFLDLFVFYFGE